MTRNYKERMKLPWPAFSPTQERGAFDKLVPTETPKYYTRVLIKKGQGIPVMTKEGRPSGSYIQSPTAKHDINTETCGSLTLCCGTIDLPPGEGPLLSGAHWHTCEEAFYIVSGRGYFEVEGERYDVEAGDWIFVPMRAKHGSLNTGDEPLRMVFAKGVRLRSYDGPTESPIDYREFDFVEEKPKT